MFEWNMALKTDALNATTKKLKTTLEFSMYQIYYILNLVPRNKI